VRRLRTLDQSEWVPAMYKLGSLGRDLRRDLLDEIEHRRIDLECQRPTWFHRPLSALELEQHPDGPRIRATIEAVAQRLVAAAIDAVISEGDWP
jgi:hypothetical protein